jgi:hypothetical protein
VELLKQPDVVSLAGAVKRRSRVRWQQMSTDRFPPEILVSEFMEAVLEASFGGIPARCYYLPAARSGILQSHKALASSVVSRAPLVGIEDMAIPKMSGVISDFISLLLTLEPEHRTALEPLARYLEGEILEGKIDIAGTPPAYPEISYEPSNGRFPLQRTSSMVSELAPVVLFLRYLVAPRDMLIIEQPESHLHPRSQLKFARAIGRLVNAKVAVALTTHSDYFVGQLNNLILAAAASTSVRRHEGYDNKETIAASSVAAYLFERRPHGAGTEVRAMDVTRKTGISDAEFSAVAEALYTDTVDLQR